MTSKHVLRTRDNLVAELMKLENKRGDLFIQNVWKRFQHFQMVYAMDQSVRHIAKALPIDLREAA